MSEVPAATLTELADPPVLDLYSLFGQPPDSPLINAALDQLRVLEGLETVPECQIQAYSGTSYHNYHRLGLSLSFSVPKSPSSSAKLDQIDLYNPPPMSETSKPANNPTATSHKPSFLPCNSQILPSPLRRDSTALEILSHLGEPTRKGGGEANLGKIGPGVWLEWTNLAEGKRGMMLEFEERGAGCWEHDRLGKARWKSAMLFVP